MMRVARDLNIKLFYASHEDRIQRRYKRFGFKIPQANRWENYIYPFKDKGWDPVVVDLKGEKKAKLWRYAGRTGGKDQTKKPGARLAEEDDLREAIKNVLPEIWNSLSKQQLSDLLNVKEIHPKDVRNVLGKIPSKRDQRQQIADLVKKIKATSDRSVGPVDEISQMDREAGTRWHQRPWARRSFLALPIVGLALYFLFSKKTPSKVAEMAKPVYHRDWVSAAKKIRNDMSKRNAWMTEHYLREFPDHKPFIDELNSNQELPLGSFVAEIYGEMLVTLPGKWKSEILTERLRSGVAMIIRTSDTEENYIFVQKMVNDERMLGFVENVLKLSLQVQGNNQMSLMDQWGIDYAAYNSSLFAIEKVLVGRKRGGLVQRLPYYGKPDSPVSNPDHVYVDLASGTNPVHYLPDIMEYSYERPILLLDISEGVIRFWDTVSQSLGLNIKALNLDIRKISKKTLPYKVGTIRLQNVGAWVPGLTEEWATTLLDLVEPE